MAITDILTISIAGVPLWFIAAIGLLLYFAMRYNGKSKLPEYKEINVEKKVQESFDELLNWFSISEGQGKVLKIGFFKVGKISSIAVVPYDGNITKLVKSRTMRKLIQEKGPEQKEAYLIKVKKPIINVPILNEILVNSKKFLIDSALVQVGDHEIIIPISTPFSEIFKVFVSSKETEFLISDQAHLKTLEQTLQKEVNFMPHGSYLENLVASKIATARESARLEKEKYRGQVEGAESG